MFRSFAVLLACVVFVTGCGGDPEPDPRLREQGAVETPSTPSTGATTSVVGRVPMKGANSAFVVLTSRTAADTGAQYAQPVMDQIQLAFVPSALIAATGQPVQFRSSDPELHNVNVTRADTRLQEFNVAIIPNGTYEYTFKNPGLYNVTCDVHPTMTAQILVASTPYVVVTGPDGNFTFEDVAPGAYTLTVYAGQNRSERELQVAPGRNDVQLGAG